MVGIFLCGSRNVRKSILRGREYKRDYHGVYAPHDIGVNYHLANILIARSRRAVLLIVNPWRQTYARCHCNVDRRFLVFVASQFRSRVSDRASSARFSATFRFLTDFAPYARGRTIKTRCFHSRTVKNICIYI